MFDLIIHGGVVVDGTAHGRLRRADVGVQAGKITAIDDLPLAAAKRCLDATGHVVTPGFIDAHSHSDAYVFIDPNATSKISQGITTEVVGHCGGSGVPVLNEHSLPSDWATLRYPALAAASTKNGATWGTVAEYRALWQQVRPAVNVVLYVGHNTLRKGVMGYAPRAATVAEIEAMARALEQALDEGAAGFSTGLLYQPGRYAERVEIARLVTVAAMRGAGYATHMRSEGDQLLEALDETLALTRATGIRTQVSHLKTSHSRNWHKCRAALKRIAAAREQGFTVHADRYPYTHGATELDVVLPEWASAGGGAAILRHLRHAATRNKIVAELNDMERDWSDVIVGGCESQEGGSYSGRQLDEVARSRGESVGETIAWLIDVGEVRTGAFFGGLSEDNLRTIYRSPFVGVGSDASLRSPQGVLGRDHPHPRAYGTMPRFFRMMVDEKLLTPTEAIWRMSGLTAHAYGLKQRGLLLPNYYADIAIWHPDAFADTATYARPHSMAQGLQAVIVNGVVTYSHGQFTGQRAGEII